MVRLALLVWFLTSCAWGSAWADPVLLLPPIEVRGSAADTLFDDPVIPSTQFKREQSSPSGSIVRELSDQLPVPITDYGYPGSVSQIRGFGRTVEDTEVETLGVPLNLAQGGGFDFSTFPEFFWSSSELRLGPVGTAFDPRASTSAIRLTPWTADALSSSDYDEGSVAKNRFTVLGGRFLGQASAAAHYGDAAILVGETVGQAHGPTGSISIQLPDLGPLHWRAHLLATSIDAATPGPSAGVAASLFSANARQTSARVIPILEASAELAPGTVVKSSLFFDRDWIHYDNPDLGTFGVTQTNQYGIENTLSSGVLTVGLSGKRATLFGEAYSVPTESSANLRAGPTFHIQSWTVDGYVGGDYVSGTGIRPNLSLGARDDFSDQLAIYTRESYSWRFPTLLDRFASDPPYSLANPSLAPEQVMTVIAGGGFRDISGRVRADLQNILQFRNNAQLFITNASSQVGETLNSGHSSEFSVLPSLGWDLFSSLEFFQSVRFSESQIDSYNQRIPYDPWLTYLVEARFHDKASTEGKPVWHADLGARMVSSSPSDYSGSRSPGYAVVHLDVDYQLTKSISFEGRIENLMNRRDVQVTSGYPLPGRLFAVGVVGSI